MALIQLLWQAFSSCRSIAFLCGYALAAVISRPIIQVVMYKALKILTTYLTVVLFSFFFAGPREAWPAAYITGSGCSISNVGYLTALAGEYQRRTGTKVFVRGGGSLVGIEDLRNGNVDFAASCRGREAGDPKGLQFIQVAWDALVFIVHKSNPVDNISLDNVRSIYEGKITNWRQLGGRDALIELFVSRSRMGLSGVETSVRDMLLSGKAVESPNARFVPSSGIVEQLVETTADGFASTGFSSASRRRVKMLKVNGVYPTVKAIVSGKYGLRRPLFLLIPSNPKPQVMKFVSFALSEEGQHFISSQGMVSVLDLNEAGP
jgi:phosphate transport system substrate-binding protein